MFTIYLLSLTIVLVYQALKQEATASTIALAFVPIYNTLDAVLIALTTFRDYLINRRKED